LKSKIPVFYKIGEIQKRQQYEHRDAPSEEPLRITRRRFHEYLAMGIASAAGALVGCTRAGHGAHRVKIIAQAGEIPVSGSKIFTYPADDRPCFLLRPAEDTYLAFSRLCTHHTCPVFYRPEDNIFACPCHAGIFSATTGAVLGGPPPRPLPQVILERHGDEIVATGFMKS
jgi:Rieske Fe-S protein